jgi:hypothetical protein
MVWFWSVAVFKIGLWIMAAVVLWLTLWARRMRQA